MLYEVTLQKEVVTSYEVKIKVEAEHEAQIELRAKELLRYAKEQDLWVDGEENACDEGVIANIREVHIDVNLMRK